MKALMTLRPPKVSSTCDIVSLQSSCASRDWRLSFLPMAPITQPSSGTTSRVKRVSFQLITMRVTK